MRAYISIFTGMNEDLKKHVYKAIHDELLPGMAGLMEALAVAGKNIWAQEAYKANPSWAGGYAANLKIESGEKSSMVYAGSEGQAAMYFRMMENGVKPWSIRDALLNSPKAKTSKKGIKYIIVPFRWKTPAKGTAKEVEKFSGTIPKDIYSIVKNGGRIGNGNGNLSGLQRYGGKHHGEYFTFRMVSQNTPKSKWQHKGKEATPVFDRILPMIQNMVMETVENYLKGFTENAS